MLLTNTVTYALEVRAALRELSRTEDIPLSELWVSFLDASLGARAMLWEYRLMRLYEWPSHTRRRFLSYRRAVKVSNRLLAGSTEEDRLVIGNKAAFNRTFADLVRRDWLYVPDSSPEDIRAFLARNRKFLAKDTLSTQGKNIFLFEGETDADVFLAEYAGRPFVLEAFLTQHPALSAINPTSVNTVRAVTACRNGRAEIVGACLRTGGKDAYVDNFHSGGVAFPLDLTEGIVTGAGRSFDGRMFLRHPATGYVVPGFTVPHWAELRRAVTEAALRIPQVGYIGWDVAVTAEGVELIEGNMDIPDHTLMQMDRPDAYKRLQDFFARCGEKI